MIVIARTHLLASFFLLASAAIGGAQQTQATDTGFLADPVAMAWGQFGRALAVDGDSGVAGSPDHGSGDGEIFTLQRTSSRWAADQVIAPSGATQWEKFGWSVAIDDDVIVVGAPQHNAGSGWQAGRVVVFVRHPATGVWAEQQVLLDPNGAAGARFGSEVAVDANQIVVSAPTPASAYPHYGSVVIFNRDRAGTPNNPTDDSWGYAQTLTQTPAASDTGFAGDISLANDTLVVGAPFTPPMGVLQGVAFVFERTGTVWQPVQQLSPSSLDYWLFGFGITVETDGTRIAVQANPLDGMSNGKVVIFEGNGGSFVETDVITSPGVSAHPDFGFGLKWSQGLLIAASPWSWVIGPNQGRVQLFGLTPGGWSLQQTLYSNSPQDHEKFGASLAFDGDFLFVGVPESGFQQTGGIYTYAMTSSNFTLYGFGDGSGAPCPCGNNSNPLLGGGCVNMSGFGGRLRAAGSDVAALDDLRMTATNLNPGKTALLFTGPSVLLPGAALGDGLRVIGGHLVRRQISLPNSSGDAFFGPGLASFGPWPIAQPVRFQAWYRDSNNSPCGTASNVTNGVEVIFQ